MVRNIWIVSGGLEISAWDCRKPNLKPPVGGNALSVPPIPIPATG